MARPPSTTPPAVRRDPTASWLVRNALELAVGLLVALFGWTSTRALDAIAADVAATAVRIERLDEALRGVLVDQASQARRIEHTAAEVVRLERRLDGLEQRLRTSHPHEGRPHER